MKIMKLWLLFMSSVINGVFGFSAPAHFRLGEMVGKYLEQHDAPFYNDLLNLLGCSFGDASVYADTLKSKPQYDWLKPLHYADIIEPTLTCATPCIFDALLNDTSGETAFDLKMLLHFTQDVVQPLHTHGAYRGGNTYYVFTKQNNKFIKSNLHHVYDSMLTINTMEPDPNLMALPLKDLLLHIVKTNLDFVHDIYNHSDYYRGFPLITQFNQTRVDTQIVHYMSLSVKLLYQHKNKDTHPILTTMQIILEILAFPFLYFTSA